MSVFGAQQLTTLTRGLSQQWQSRLLTASGNGVARGALRKEFFGTPATTYTVSLGAAALTEGAQSLVFSRAMRLALASAALSEAVGDWGVTTPGATILAIPANPTVFTGGSFDAANKLNTGVWTVTVVPTAASTTYTGGTFHAILGQVHGGLWLVDNVLTLFTAPGDLTAFAQTLTWSAGQPITITVDTRAGSRKVVIAGATTGNGSFTFAQAGPYFDNTLLLEAGRFGVGTFTFVGTISNVTDASVSLTLASLTFSEAVGTLAMRAARRLALGTASLTETAGDMTVVTASTIATASAPFTLAAGGLTFRRAMRFTLGVGALSETVGDMTMVPGGALGFAAHDKDFQLFGYASRAWTVPLNTQASGSCVVIAAAGQSSDVGGTWTDSGNGSNVRKISSVVDYPDFAGYGIQYGLTRTKSGGNPQTFGGPVTAGTESTVFATEVIAPAGRRTKLVNSNTANASGSTSLAIAITVDGPAAIIFDWWGSSPVVPPFSTPAPGVGTTLPAYVATPSISPTTSISVSDEYLVNNEYGEVQGKRIGILVATAGTYTCTWAQTPSQGAQLWAVAVQLPYTVALDSASISLAVGTVAFRRAMRLTLESVSIAEAVGTLTPRVSHTLASGVAAITQAVGTLGFVRAMRMSLGSVALTESTNTLGFHQRVGLSSTSLSESVSSIGFRQRIGLSAIALSEGVGAIGFRQRIGLASAALAESIGTLGFHQHVGLSNASLTLGVGTLGFRRSLVLPAASASLSASVGTFNMRAGRVLAAGTTGLSTSVGSLSFVRALRVTLPSQSLTESLGLFSFVAGRSLTMDSVAESLSVGSLTFRRAMVSALESTSLSESVGTFNMRAGRVLAAGTSAISGSVGTLAFRRALRIQLDGIDFSEAIGTFNLRAGRMLAAGTVGLSLTPGDLTFRTGNVIAAESVSHDVSVGSVGFLHDRVIQLESVSLSVVCVATVTETPALPSSGSSPRFNRSKVAPVSIEIEMRVLESRPVVIPVSIEIEAQTEMSIHVTAEVL